MPDLSASLPTIRKDGYSIDLYFTPLIGVQIWTGTVASTPTFPANALSITGGVGTIADVKRGMRVTVETSGSIFKGETHIRAAGTISSTVIPIRETSKGTINIASGDVIRVYNAIYLQDKLVSADASFSPDNLAYSAQNSTVPPIAISGGHFVGFVDSGQAYRTVVFAGSESYTVDADSGGTVTHSWVFPTATGTTSSSSANPTFTFPVGYHIGSHTVTDSSNSAPWTQFIMGRVYDADNPPYECVVNNVDTSPESGWSTSVQLFADASLTDIPDKCMGIVWSEETYAGVIQSFGNVIPSRSHIKAVGYVSRDTNRFDPVNSTLTFDLISPLARLQQLPGYSKVMLNTASPDKWREIEDLSVKRALIVLLRYYTNLTEIFDFLYDADEYAFPRFYLQKNTPAAQVNELADGVDARFVANRTGRFMVQKRQELTILGSRSALTTTLTLTTDDIADYEFSRDHFRTVELLEARGFIADQDDPTPIFARWPGLAPGQGTQSSVVERLIAASQADLNRRAGLRGAALDGVYIASNDAYRRSFDIRLTLRGAYDVFDFYKEWIALDINGTTNLRGVDLSDYRFTFQGASISYDHSTSSAVTDLTLRAETAAPAGVKYSPTTPINSNTPDYTPPDLDIGFTPVPNATLLLPGYTPGEEELPIRVFALRADSNEAAIAESYDSGTGVINWVEINTGLTGNGQWASGDPYDYGRLFALTTTGLYKCEDIWSFDSWSLVASNAAMFGDASRIGHKVVMSINRRGYIIVACGTNLTISTDYGLTWTQTDYSGAGAWSTTGTGTELGDVAISPHGNGYVYAAKFHSSTNSRFYRSTDWGASWTLRGTYGTAAANPRIFVPYTKKGGVPNLSDSSQDTYYVYAQSNSGELRFVPNGFSGTFVTVFDGGVSGEIPAGRRMSVVNFFTWDSSYVHIVGRGTGVGANRWAVWVTDDQITFTQPQENSGSQDTVMINGWALDPNVAIVWSNSSTLVSITLDNWVTRFGSAPSGWSGSAYVEFSLVDYVPPA